MANVMTLLARVSRAARRLGQACLLVGACVAPWSRFGPCGPINDASAVAMLTIPIGLAVWLLGGLLYLPSALTRHRA